MKIKLKIDGPDVIGSDNEYAKDPKDMSQSIRAKIDKIIEVPYNITDKMMINLSEFQDYFGFDDNEMMALESELVPLFEISTIIAHGDYLVVFIHNPYLNA